MNVLVAAKNRKSQALASRPLRSGPAWEVELDNPVMLCTWHQTSATDGERSTTVALKEQDVLDGLANLDGRELSELTVLIPTLKGWKPRDVVQMWRLDRLGADADGARLMLQDAAGERYLFRPDPFGSPAPARLAWTAPGALQVGP